MSKTVDLWRRKNNMSTLFKIMQYQGNLDKGGQESNSWWWHAQKKDYWKSAKGLLEWTPWKSRHWQSVDFNEGNEDGGTNKTLWNGSRTSTSRSPRVGQDKAFDPRKGVVPGGRCTGRKESKEVHGLSSQHTSTGIIDGTIKNVKNVDINFCGPFPSWYYSFVAIDEYSRFPEVEITTSTSANSTIPKLDKIFSTHGIPEVVKSDNVIPFHSSEFAEHAGFQYNKITAEWPEWNREIHANHRKGNSLRNTWRKRVEAGNVSVSTHNYRATPYSLTGVHSATALFNKNIRTTLPENKEVLKSDITMRESHARAKSRMKQYADKRAKAKSSSLKPEDIVMMKHWRTK